MQSACELPFSNHEHSPHPSSPTRFQNGIMKTLQATRFITIPEGVTVTIKNRVATVTGKRGTLKRAFKHLQLEVTRVSDEKIRVDAWLADRKALACVRTFCTHVMNMMKGVTYGYRYVLKAVYAHFPINMQVIDGGKAINIRNFLGEKVTRHVCMHDGVIVKASGNKDELYVEGNDIEKVSLSAALIHQSCLVTRKDIRKFLDGIYCSETTTIDPIEE
ncbi:ribosomal protein L9 [Salpingoeca rosetta]|uniref:Ribosomal protein L9 n=1 Tax=Salpingoeca rosetta (strain ATCC 50818 / BSB-021) TaxID=946362 RepID=F2UNS5_SALR5|nr:ribosomal protein L9 [Salpingoeca rosetta]EGD79280.1 ribosomal protein L9 [Salpingoeca rosetta]|eukprot:XP_004989051.1 ribosomal protein L9 [Salpingoeca rosetta]